MRRNTLGPPLRAHLNALSLKIPGRVLTLSTLGVASLLRLCELRFTDARTYRLRLTCAGGKVENTSRTNSTERAAPVMNDGKEGDTETTGTS